MSSNDIAIRVQNLSKCYQIYDTPRDRLKQFFAPRLQSLVGQTSKQYFREFWALKDISFEIKKGETVGIIGRNGSGKSTLLQIICGTLTPTSGSVETRGRIAALLELGSGFNPEFTGRENVYMNAAVLGLSKEEIDARFDDIAAFADIGDFIEQPVKTYSSGMTVRLAFAVIAHVDADILVIDEALSVGDAFFTQKCMRFLRKFMEKGTVLFVSHDTGAVINFCQRAIWLNKGISKYQGEPKDVAQKYLAELYESQQGESVAVPNVSHSDNSLPTGQLRDMRLDFINTTNHRNDIELFSFVPDAASFGKGGGNITLVQLLDETGQPLAWVVGGEKVRLIITCLANTNMFSPIIGFLVNDRLGQPIFGDNTFNFSKQSPLIISSGEKFEAEFEFRMPILPMGDYSITVALAEGTQQDHIQHHWVHDALSLKSHSSSVSTGLVGVPMSNVSVSVR
ncbi:ABC transporter ATP-binding protein [Sulfuriferula plumbiphila]|uniref:ABC transporter ATP-binding protein n=1 Tax=Sulfuriferula plumbiphila TaxID=171865 RepID=A0A512LCE2_9PROT|nr:ABC transporter ATP-binding protein [Sulfuriferula plumbiphila]BBP05746.1 ABC transporter ATP-binding protein [Sulfuriferula plumbiphila]GEP32164.1 ABC transporter ATP-binding protein [Sulfuriferula plumbiphila]